MTAELVIAIIALAGVIVSSIMQYRANKEKTNADITDIVFRAAEGIRKNLQEDLEKKDMKLKELDGRLETLNKAATDAYFVLSYIYNTATDLIKRFETINMMIGGEDLAHIKVEIEAAKAELEGIQDKINEISKN